MKALLHRHRSLWSERSYLSGVLIGLLLLGLGISATYYANSYTTKHASNAVTDIILDNVPIVNVSFIFNQGAALFIAILFCIVFYEPRRLPFVLKSISLFIIIRSLFMVLTHIAPPISKSYIDTTNLLYKISSGDDLFFSAHTGLPFLLSIIFWNEPKSRAFFLFATLVGGTSVLLGHLHYSIDVFSALFIAFGIFHLAVVLFPRDHRLFEHAS